MILPTKHRFPIRLPRRFIVARIMTLSVVIMLALPFSPQPARAEDSMIWALTPLPPAMIEKDGKIVGYGVDILDWFIARMPAITHTKEIVPLARLMQKMTMPGTVCNIGLVPTPERRQFLIFPRLSCHIFLSH